MPALAIVMSHEAYRKQPILTSATSLTAICKIFTKKTKGINHCR